MSPARGALRSLSDSEVQATKLNFADVAAKLNPVALSAQGSVLISPSLSTPSAAYTPFKPASTPSDESSETASARRGNDSPSLSLRERLAKYESPENASVAGTQEVFKSSPALSTPSAPYTPYMMPQRHASPSPENDPDSLNESDKVMYERFVEAGASELFEWPSNELAVHRTPRDKTRMRKARRQRNTHNINKPRVSSTPDQSGQEVVHRVLSTPDQSGQEDIQRVLSTPDQSGQEDVQRVFDIPDQSGQEDVAEVWQMDLFTVSPGLSPSAPYTPYAPPLRQSDQSGAVVPSRPLRLETAAGDDPPPVPACATPIDSKVVPSRGGEERRTPYEKGLLLLSAGVICGCILAAQLNPRALEQLQRQLQRRLR